MSRPSLSSLIPAVFRFLKSLPKSQVISYGALARRCAVPSPRNVGWILKQNSRPHKIPCYKVVRADGKLAGGYKFGGSRGQKKRLLADGIKFTQSGKIFPKFFIHS